MRRCPRCTYPLHAADDGKSELDNCRRCGGSWLLPHAALGNFGPGSDPARWERDKIAEAAGVSSLRCPEGHGQLARWIIRHQGSKVEVDTCEACTGLWLDRREGAFLARRLRESDTGSAPYAPGVVGYLFQLVTGFPVEEWNPVKRKPLVIYALLGAVFAATVAQFIHQQDGSPAEQQAFGDGLFLVPATVLAGGAPWTLLTHMFLHTSLLHLAGNMWFLWVFGDNVEDVLGRGKTLLLFFVAGLVGAMAHVAVYPTDTTPMIGASGGVAGLLGAYLVLFPRIKVWVIFLFVPLRLHVSLYLGLWVLLQVLGIAMGEETTAWWAHIGGFATGVMTALMLRGTSRDRTLLRSLQSERGALLARPWEHAPHANQRRYTTRGSRRR